MLPIGEGFDTLIQLQTASFMTRVCSSEPMTLIHDPHRALLAVSEAIVSQRDLSALVHELADRLRHVVRFDYLGLYLYQAEGNSLRLYVLEPSGSIMPSAFVSIPVEETPAGLVWQTQQPIVLSNLAEVASTLNCNGVNWGYFGRLRWVLGIAVVGGDDR